MRVLQLGPYPPPHGGVQTNLVQIRDYLRAHGHRCGVINLTRHRRPNADEVYFPNTAVEALRLIRKLPYDILHLHIGGAAPLRLLLLSLVCCWMPGRKAVLTFHSGGYATSPEGRAASPRTFAGFVFRRFDRIVAVNSEIVELFQRYDVRQDRVRLIQPYAAVPQTLDTPLPPALAAFFEKHSPALLSVGLLEDEYDLPIQIELLGRLRERYPAAGLAMIGSGSREGSLRALIASKPYDSEILLCGDVAHAATLRAIAECDVLLRTTLYDGDSISVREALQLGRPVIATDNGMRPAGVHCIPVSDLDALEAETCRILSGGTREEVVPQRDEANLEAVEALYFELSEKSAVQPPR
jgi:glycosyltransferase involved in cell wall biosynthesis